MNLALALLSLLVTSAASGASSAATASPEVTIGMPFAGRWAYNVERKPPYTDENSSHPSVHRLYSSGSDWATDLYAKAGTKVRLHLSSSAGSVTIALRSSGDSCGEGFGGRRVSYKVSVAGRYVGFVSFSHLDDPKTKPPFENGMVIGTVTAEKTKKGCFETQHVHLEAGNDGTGGHACYVEHGTVGKALSEGVGVGRLASNVSARRSPCSSLQRPSSGASETSVVTRTSNSVTSRRGPVTVIYSWSGKGLGGKALLGRQLEVRRSGRTVYEASAVTARCARFDFCKSALLQPPLIVNLDADTEYEIVVAQREEAGDILRAKPCCVSWIVLDWTGRVYWRTDYTQFKVLPTFIDPERDGRPQIRSLLYEFQPVACADCWVLPLVIYDFDSRRHRLSDSTCRYPDLVAVESKMFLSRLQAYIQRVERGGARDLNGLPRAIAAAWAADEVRLGRGGVAFQRLELWARDGVLEVGEAYEDALGGTREFIGRLRRNLPKFGIRVCTR